MLEFSCYDAASADVLSTVSTAHRPCHASSCRCRCVVGTPNEYPTNKTRLPGQRLYLTLEIPAICDRKFLRFQRGPGPPVPPVGCATVGQPFSGLPISGLPYSAPPVELKVGLQKLTTQLDHSGSMR